jgi:predicted TPR repeat methyltransferase
MKKLPDISEWYTKERTLAAEVDWLFTKPYKAHLEFLLPHIRQYGVKSVVEFGCGTGHVGCGLPSKIDYLGVDSNEHMRQIAMRNLIAPSNYRNTELADIREWSYISLKFPRDLSTAWNFLKHFGLHEWNEIVKKLLSHGRYGAFSMQISDHDFDNGTEYHHVFVTEAHLESAVEAAGHRVIFSHCLHAFDLGKDVAYWTERK